MVVIASVSVAALNIIGLLVTWWRTGAVWPRLVGDLVTVRINYAFPDPNPRDLYLVMGLVAALGLAFRHT